MAIRILLSQKLGEVRWTQAELARATGIRCATINELYHELSNRVNLEHLNKICQALDCSLSDLLVYEPDEELAVKKVAQSPSKSVRGNKPPDYSCKDCLLNYI